VEVGQKIKHLRGELAQEQLALIAGISTSTLSRIERGAYQPRLPTLRKIAQALGVRVGELLDDEHPTTGQDDDRVLAPGPPQGAAS
jgi:transcriptional regulator with XRE-family HTH domain